MLFTNKNGALFLLIILLLGLVLCSVLGGNCNSKEGFKGENQKMTPSTSSKDKNTSAIRQKNYEGYDNYNHYSGDSVPTTLYGPNGGTATIQNENGNYSVLITDSNGSTTLYTTNTTSSVDTPSNTPSSVSQKTYYGPNGEVANVYYGSNGEYIVEVVDQNGNKVVYSSRTNTAYTNADTDTYTYTTTGSSTTTSYTTSYDTYQKTIYYGPNGGTARIVSNSSTGQYAVEVTSPNGKRVVYSSKTNTIYTNGEPVIKDVTYYGANGAYAIIVTGENGEYVIKVTDSYGNTVVYSSKTNTVYTNTSDPYYYNGTNYNVYSTNGIPASAIPPGDEDLYILKSQVVPPVCPACPTSSTCPRQEPCPACPACARCPEPAFECKKVPNYNNISDNYLPIPVLSDFSTFGM